ncbi:MAG: DUF6364 family protein [Candidatus Competibacteraceae bacterium]|nr:DUF6364 family protein [Candidatus Competibacteraceae bacterium]
MQTKLTLRLDAALIERAKAHAAQQNKSLSRLVADYFVLLDEPPPKPRGSTPLVSSLRGAWRGADLDEASYRQHLEDKYL